MQQNQSKSLPLARKQIGQLIKLLLLYRQQGKTTFIADININWVKNSCEFRHVTVFPRKNGETKMEVCFWNLDPINWIEVKELGRSY